MNPNIKNESDARKIRGYAIISKGDAPEKIGHPHSKFNGLTPSEVAGIKLNLQGNRWESLLRKSVEIDNQHKLNNEVNL